MVDGDRIDTLLLSCRILGKGIESAFLKQVMKLLKDEGILVLRAEFIPTLKNGQVKDFYDRCGFVCITEGEDGMKGYVGNLKDIDLSIEEYYHIRL